MTVSLASLLVLAQGVVWPVASTDEFIAAESAAQGGDVIELQPGVYAFLLPNSFRVDVGVTITVANAGRASIQSQVTPPFVENSDPDNPLRLERLDFSNYPSIYNNSGGGLSIRDGAGSVWLEDCTATVANTMYPGLRVGATSAVIRGGRYEGSLVVFPMFGSEGGPGIEATGSTIMAQGAEFIGSAGHSARARGATINIIPSTTGGPGVRLNDTTATFADCTVVGGDGGDGYLAFDPGGGPYCGSASAGAHAFEFGDGGASVLSVQAGLQLVGEGGEGNAFCDPLPAPDGLYFGGPGMVASAIDQEFFPLLLHAPTEVAPGSTAIVEFTTKPWPTPHVLALAPRASVGLISNAGMTSFLGGPISLFFVTGGYPATQFALPVANLPPGTPFIDVFLQGIELAGGLGLTAPAATLIR